MITAKTSGVGITSGEDADDASIVVHTLTKSGIARVSNLRKACEHARIQAYESS